MLSFIKIIRSWFVHDVPEEDVIYYAEYICPLPPNWIPGDGMKMDVKFTMEQAEALNYKECIDRLKETRPENLNKNTPYKKLLFMQDAYTEEE